MSLSLFGVLSFLVLFVGATAALVLAMDRFENDPEGAAFIGMSLAVITIVPLTFVPVAATVGLITVSSAELLALQAGVLLSYYVLWGPVLSPPSPRL